MSFESLGLSNELLRAVQELDYLNLVINYEIPNLPEDYVHRIGRTGRAGAEGVALSLVTQEELYLLAPIEKLIKAKIPQAWVEGFAPTRFEPKKSVVKRKGRWR